MISAKNSVLLISHGAPDVVIRETPAHNFMKNLGQEIARPEAIIVFSAHYESKEIEISGAEKLQTIYDFSGFPAQLYEMNYDVAGSPKLAAEILQLFAKENLPAKINPTRGIDHGAWSPLKLIYPKQEIPVIQISIQPYQDAAYHYRIGQIISQLKAKNILIIASGNVTHNLYEVFRTDHEQTPNWVEEFNEEFFVALKNNDIESFLNWQNFSHAKKNHPSPEHFVPFLIALGAAGTNFVSSRLHRSFDYAVLSMDCYALTSN